MRFLLFTLHCSLLTILIGCGASYKFPLAQTTGVVLCDGKPVSFATVYFVPQREGTSPLAGKTGLATTAEDGTFSISTYQPGDGAVVAKHTVRVDKTESTPPSCPAALSSTKVVQTVDVVNGKNTFTIELPKRHRSR